MTVRTDAGMISFFICAVSDRNPSSAGQSRAYGARSMRLRSRDAAKLEWRRRASLRGRCDVLPRKSRATRCRAIRSRASPAAARVPATGHATAPAPSRVMNPRRLTSRRLRDTPIGARWSATQATLYLKEQLARSPHQFSDALAFRESAFLLPRGAPDPNAPPCMRQHLLPWTDGELQGLPERVLAPQRRLASIGPVLRL